MKTFTNFVHQLSEAKTKDKVVFQKKVDGVDTMITKDGSNFIAFIDGDRLDSYSSQKEAEKSIIQFLKQYKG